MLFSGGSNADPKAVSKEARREIKSGQRDIEKEIRDLERSEQKCVAEAKALAKKGDMNGAKMAAKNVVQIRNAKQRRADLCYFFFFFF
jgi:soluble cytochrome b562